MADLSPKEVKDVAFAFDVFANDEGVVDAVDLPHVIRALNLNPSLKALEKLECPKRKGEKTLKLDEVLPIYSQLKKDKKDEGCYEDFVECLKLYDKKENGRMLSADLVYTMLFLGEKLSEEEMDVLFADCLGRENEDGEVEYIPFLKKMCGMEPAIQKGSVRN